MQVRIVREWKVPRERGGCRGVGRWRRVIERCLGRWVAQSGIEAALSGSLILRGGGGSVRADRCGRRERGNFGVCLQGGVARGERSLGG